MRDVLCTCGAGDKSMQHKLNCQLWVEILPNHAVRLQRQKRNPAKKPLKITKRGETLFWGFMILTLMIGCGILLQNVGPS